MKRLLVMVAVLFSLWGFGASPVMVVPADLSGRPADRAYIKRMTLRVEQWLDGAGIKTRRRSEATFKQGIPAERVALLVGQQNVSPALLRGYRAYLRSGGKLIVFYGSSAPLAELMGFRLGRYVSDGSGQRFRQMRFGAKRPVPVPETISQRSRNIRAAWPQSIHAGVLARWYDADGQDTGQPACLASKQGYWLTHLLLPAGGDAERQALLLGLVADCDARVWSDAAARRIRDAHRVLPGDDPFIALRASIAKQSNEGRRDLALRLHNKAMRLSERLSPEQVAKDPKTAWQQAVVLQRYLVQAYGAAQPGGPQGERRAVWERTGEGPFPGNWGKSCRLLAAAGFTDLFVHVLSPGFARYPDGPWSIAPDGLQNGDQLAACLKAGHDAGIRVHAWVMAWPIEMASAATQAMWRRDGRLSVDVDGKTIDWLEPADSRNRAALIAAVRDLVSRYDVDGIHLDYIRYLNGRSGFGPANLKRFRAGHPAPAEWPRSAWIGGDSGAYRAWKVGNITRTVEGVRAAIVASGNALPLSAAVFGGYPACIEGVAQDWDQWLEDGHVDFVCPMNYTDNFSDFQAHLVMQRVGDRIDRVWPGIGVHANESVLGAVETIRQIQAVRKRNGRAFALYAFDRYIVESVLPTLTLGTMNTQPAGR